MYAAETVIDIALGISILVLYGSAFILSVITPILMEDDMMGPSNVFFMLSGFSLFGALYTFCFIKETLGLTDKQKKTLYLTKK